MLEMIIRLQNDMVMVFDAAGEQVPEYQGKYGDVKESILRDASSEASFVRCFNQADRLQDVSRENW